MSLDGHRAHLHHVQGHNVVLDIGGDIGALLIYTSPRRAGDEIEVCPAQQPWRRIHSQVHARFVGDATVYAAVYPELEAGEYVCCEESSARPPFTISGGAVTELDWR